MEIRFPSAAAWMPVSKVPNGDGSFTAFPHLLDRYKPGVIAVTRNGRRFCNESESYHDVGAAMIEACAGEAETAAWLICDTDDDREVRPRLCQAGAAAARAAVRNGYLKKGATLAELANEACGIDAAALEATVAEYNRGAVRRARRAVPPRRDRVQPLPRGPGAPAEPLRRAGRARGPSTR